ncbi:MAG: 2-oxo-4-hydroxy-4-carboxy-5-ureidoimidazoline decarboxylase [Betaproteobacteria bacterium]|nr:2-oxo-4-hydroxy-4-carboxy-5-ureidoimidazoline decarboxylase [Betaproteobacteria bacterium]
MNTWIDALNAASEADALAMLEGLYEHSPWVAQGSVSRRPFRSLAHLKRIFVEVVHQAGEQAQTALLLAHPELAGKAAIAKDLTASSLAEQTRSGLQSCSPEEFAAFHELNRQYRERFGWPFILAIGGPQGTGLSRKQILDTWNRRLGHQPASERAECLRQVHRIAELRLRERSKSHPGDGKQVMQWADDLAIYNDPAIDAGAGLQVLYLSDAHQACAHALSQWMIDCGFDSVTSDAVGNVIAVYEGDRGEICPTLLTGSHFDTVRGGGRYDGRLGIFLAMQAVARKKALGQRWPFRLELIAFAEEEGQRFPSNFLAASALVGQWDAKWLDLADQDGVKLADLMRQRGMDPEACSKIGRQSSDACGFIEIHIEQGPVLLEADLPLGVVSSINGSSRWLIEFVGTASHAGTTPMALRQDAACGAAEFALAVESRCASEPGLVGTVGMLEVPQGSINVIPGRCRFSLDLRAPRDEQRDCALSDLFESIEAICAKRGLRYEAKQVTLASASPSSPHLQAQWERAVEQCGLPIFRLPSGAGHDAMRMAALFPQAMLFVRCGHGGISHNPLESITDDDTQLAFDALWSFLENFSHD